MLEKDELLEATARLTPQWLAGFFDGEGCVHVSFVAGNPHPRIMVNITQSEPMLLVLIATKFDIPCGPYPKKHARSKKLCYEVNWNGRSVLPILSYIKDFVILKKKQVELGIEFANLIPGRGHDIPLEWAQRRKEIHEQMKVLNNKEKSELYDELKTVLSAQQKEVLS